MPRRSRTVIPGCPHHVTHRGNRGAAIFFGTADREHYLGLLAGACEVEAVSVLAYCLMTNHVHLILVPGTGASMGRVIAHAHGNYSRHVNTREGWVGSLFAGRYFSSPLGEDRLATAILYVEQNPVRAGLVRKASDYPWSSARARLSGGSEALLCRAAEVSLPRPPLSAGAVEPISASDVEMIRSATRRGLPIGTLGREKQR